MSTFILGALAGLLTGLLIAYWKQIKAVYENKDKIEAASNFFDAGSTLADSFGLKL